LNTSCHTYECIPNEFAECLGCQMEVRGVSRRLCKMTHTSCYSHINALMPHLWMRHHSACTQHCAMSQMRLSDVTRMTGQDTKHMFDKTGDCACSLLQTISFPIAVITTIYCYRCPLFVAFPWQVSMFQIWLNVCACTYIYECVYMCICPSSDIKWTRYISTYACWNLIVNIQGLRIIYIYIHTYIHWNKIVPDLQICCPCALPFHKNPADVWYMHGNMCVRREGVG